MVRSQRTKKIVTLVDNQIQLEETEAEINISRIIGEYSRSRTNVELYILLQNEIIPEILATQKEVIKVNETELIQWLNREGLDLDRFVFEDTLHDLAIRPYARRRHAHPLFAERTSKLEFRRMNVVIRKFLEGQSLGRWLYQDLRADLGM